MTTTVDGAGVPGGSGGAVVAPVEHGTEAELEQFLADDGASLGADGAGDSAGAVGVTATEVAEVAEGAGEAEDAGDGGDGNADGDVDAHQDDATLPKGVQKRINRLTALRREAEEARDASAAEHERVSGEIVALRGQLEQATVDGAVSLGSSRMAAIQSERELEAYAGRLMQIKGLLSQNPDGYESEDGNVSLSAPEVQQKLLAIDQQLMVDYPRAVRVMGQRLQANAAAAQVYPDLFGKDGSAAPALSGALMHVPGLAVLPNAAVLVGDMLAGERLRNAGLALDAAGKVVRKAGAAAPAGKVKGSAVPATSARPPAPVVAPSRGSAVGPGGPASGSGGAVKRGFERVAAEGTEEALMAAFMEE